MNHFIPLSVPNLKGNELKYVTEAVATEWVSTGGPYVTEFENKIAEGVNVKGVIACQNGTAGIHTALMTVGVKKDDIVIVPTLTFIAAVNPVKYIGATPIFMDCDDSLCIDPKKLKEFCEFECEFVDNELLFKLTKQKVKALVVVHVFGNMADMENILDIAKKYNLKVIEDATEAIGTYYSEGPLKGKYAGTMGDIGIYSFNGNKIITTGGGGMIVSNNEEYLKLAKHLTTQAKSDELNYIHDMIGYNYRMTNLQAALGLAQLEQLEKFIAAKNKNYDEYSLLLNDTQFKLLKFREGIRSNKWFYALECENSEQRDNLIAYLLDKKIQTRPIWGLINEQKPYLDAYAYKIEKAKYYWEHVVNIPCSTNITDEEIKAVVEQIKLFN